MVSPELNQTQMNVHFFFLMNANLKQKQPYTGKDKEITLSGCKMSHLDGKVCQNDVVSVIERGNLKLSLNI